MEEKYSKAELLQLAISMESEGVKFYNNYAKMAEGKIRETLLQFAKDEEAHVKVFKKMYNDLYVSKAEENYLFSDNIVELFDTYAENIAFVRENVELTTLKSVFEESIKTEQITIDFYKSLVQYANNDVKETLLQLIEEETKHRKTLAEIATTL